MKSSDCEDPAPRLPRIHGWIYPALAGATLGLGAMREMAIASEFGLGSELDSYAAVFCLYIFLGRQLGNGLETTFIAKYANVNDFELRQHLVSTQVVFAIGTLGLLLAVLAVGRPFFALVFGFQDSQLEEAVHILFSFAPAILLCALVSLPRAVLYIRNHYMLGFSHGGILSISVMGTIYLGASTFGIICLPLGYAIGNLIALLVASLQIKRILPFRAPEQSQSPPTVNRSRPIELWQPVALVLVVEMLFQGNYITERAFVAKTGPGALSTYFYAVSILMVFAALVLQPVSTLVFPKISRAYQRDRAVARRFVLRTMAGMFALSVIATAAMFGTSDFIINTLLVRGNFTAADGAATAQVFRILVFLLPFMSISRILKNAIYSGGSFHLPVATSLVRWIILAVACSVLTPSFGINGVALASIAATGADTLLMFLFFIRRP